MKAAAHARRGAKDRGEYRQAAGASASAASECPLYRPLKIKTKSADPVPIHDARSPVVRIGQELFLVRDDLRQRVRVQHSVLVLIRKTGSDGLAKQRDHMIEAGRTIGRRRRRRVNDQRPGTAAILREGPRRIQVISHQVERNTLVGKLIGHRKRATRRRKGRSVDFHCSTGEGKISQINLSLRR